MTQLCYSVWGCCAGMRELLRVAGDESQDEPWARVHAINTLRLTFNDRNLANDVSGFFAEGAVQQSAPQLYIAWTEVYTVMHALSR